MKKPVKVILSVLCVIVAAAVIFALINIKNILLVFGIGRLDVKKYDAVVTTLQKSGEFTDIQVVKGETEGDDVITCKSNDGVVDFVIKGKQGEAITKIDATIDGRKVKNLDYTDVNALSDKAKAYLSPIIADNQVLGLSGFIAREALDQYNEGKTQIVIEQDFDGVFVSIHGDIATEQMSVEIQP